MHLVLTLDIGGIWWETDLVTFSLGMKNAVVVQSVRFEITDMFVFQQYQVDRYTWSFQEGSENKLNKHYKCL